MIIRRIQSPHQVAAGLAVERAFRAQIRAARRAGLRRQFSWRLVEAHREEVARRVAELEAWAGCNVSIKWRP